MSRGKCTGGEIFSRTETRSSARRSSRDRSEGQETGPACISGSRRPAAARAADLPRNAAGRAGHDAQEPPRSAPPQALRTETAAQGPRPRSAAPAAGPQQVRTTSGARHQRNPAEISGTQEGRPPSGPARHPPQGLTGNRSGPSQDTRTRSGRSAAPRISARSRPTRADETGSSSGKGTGNGEKGPPRAGNGTGGGMTGDRERLRALHFFQDRAGDGPQDGSGTGRRASAY